MDKQQVGFKDYRKWNKEDTVWMLGLFGTAIGAGVLFLPINAGIGGALPLLVVTFLAFPITYLAHRALARFILSSTSADGGIAAVIGEYWGSRAQKIFNIIYFFAIYTILLMYAVAITNTAESVLVHQLHIDGIPRLLIALLLIIGLLSIVRLGQEKTMKAMSYLVYPFIGMLIIIALYLIPQWNLAFFEHVFDKGIITAGVGQGLFMTLWMTFPVLVMSFNHYPIISPFVVAQRHTYGEKADIDKKCSVIQRNSYLLMVTVVLFFVYSCVLSLSPEDLVMAKKENISILSYLANHFNTPFITWIGPLIAFVAIMKSFLGHYVGAYESMRDIVIEVAALNNKTISHKMVDKVILLFMVTTCIFTAYINPSILGIIESISGPTGAVILLLLPMYAIYTCERLRAYRKASNYFVIIVGSITVSAIFYGLI